MRTFFVTTLLLLILSYTFAQHPLSVRTCAKIYGNDSTIAEHSRTLYVHDDDFFVSACSWTCNPYIRFHFQIPGEDTSASRLIDYKTLSSGVINAPIKKKIIGEVSLDRYLPGEKISKKEIRDVYLRGFLIANGNRGSREEYLRYSRLKKIQLYIQDRLIGSILLQDTPEIQYVDFGEFYRLRLRKKIMVTIEIEEVYPGDQGKALSIAEIQMDGSGGHSMTSKFCLE